MSNKNKTICDFCRQEIPSDEWINTVINNITGEQNHYCEDCRKYFEARRKKGMT